MRYYIGKRHITITMYKHIVYINIYFIFKYFRDLKKL